MKLPTILLVLVLTICSCGKKDDSCNSSGLLFNVNWVLVDKGTDTDNDGIIENSQFATVPDCWKDDYHVFKCGETLVKYDNANQCVARVAVAEIHWHFVRDSLFYIRDEGYRVIKKLTPDQLQVRTSLYNGSIPPGGSILYYYEKR